MTMDEDYRARKCQWAFEFINRYKVLQGTAKAPFGESVLSYITSIYTDDETCELVSYLKNKEYNKFIAKLIEFGFIVVKR